MGFTDKQIQCVDCGNEFTFTAAEQEFFAQKGYTNEPKRCLPCRQARKSERGGGAGGSDQTCRNIPQFALNVAKKLKYRSSPDRVDRYIAALATAKMRQNQTGKIAKLLTS